jgi:magnesium-transporting ATPase (P-type)
MDPHDSSDAKQLQIPLLIRGSIVLDVANTDDNNNNNGNGNGNGNSGNQVVVTIDMLTMALLLASVLYAFCLILAKRKLSLLSRLDPEMSTKKLLVLSVALVSAVRIMTILGVAMMNVANVRAHYSLHPPGSSNSSHDRGGSDRHQDFYDEAMTVLFDLPNVMVVSTYVLLTLVWAECFLESRLHTESATTFRRTWLIFFMVFNSCLYMAQITLYGSIFLAPVNTVVRTIIYVGITGINFTAVLLVLIFYIYLNVRFSVRKKPNCSFSRLCF